mmetsp:Transcript_91882/g.259526  ORF Transcript_91882/g.259526 Transcript_91882/m.259526 type:complete len:418 (-) Transcript_91882:1152-2405(-)
MTRVHPVIAGGGGKQHGGQLLSMYTVSQQMIRRNPPQLCPLRGLVGVTVLFNPARAREKPVVGLHVQQRNLPHQSPETFGRAHQHVAHKKPAVGPPEKPETPRHRKPSATKVIRYCFEVLVRPKPPSLPGCVAPGGTELAAAADVCFDVSTAPLQPSDSYRALVSGQDREIKATVRIEQCGAACCHMPRTSCHKIRHQSAVLGDGLKLSRPHSGGLELRPQLLHSSHERCRLPCCWRLAARGLPRATRSRPSSHILHEEQRRWLQVRSPANPERVRAARVNGPHAQTGNGAASSLGRRHWIPRPASHFGIPENYQIRTHLGEHDENQEVSGSRHVLQHGRARSPPPCLNVQSMFVLGLPDGRPATWLFGQRILGRRCQQRAGSEGSGRPRYRKIAPEPQQYMLAEKKKLGVCGSKKP